MRFKLLIMVLVLVPLLGCAATPQKQEETMDSIPHQFLGYWEYAGASVESGLQIFWDWRMNWIDNRDGYILNRLDHKFIYSPDPNTLYMMMQSLDFPDVFLYTKYVINNANAKNTGCVLLRPYSLMSADPKDWKNFNQAKEILKVKAMISDKALMDSFSAVDYQKCLYLPSRSF